MGLSAYSHRLKSVFGHSTIGILNENDLFLASKQLYEFGFLELSSIENLDSMTALLLSSATSICCIYWLCQISDFHGQRVS